MNTTADLLPQDVGMTTDAPTAQSSNSSITGEAFQPNSTVNDRAMQLATSSSEEHNLVSTEVSMGPTPALDLKPSSIDWVSFDKTSDTCAVTCGAGEKLQVRSKNRWDMLPSSAGEARSERPLVEPLFEKPKLPRDPSKVAVPPQCRQALFFQTSFHFR